MSTIASYLKRTEEPELELELHTSCFLKDYIRLKSEIDTLALTSISSNNILEKLNNFE